jgi:plastocyanin
MAGLLPSPTRRAPMNHRHTVRSLAAGLLLSGLLLGCDASTDDLPEGGMSDVDAPDTTDAGDDTGYGTADADATPREDPDRELPTPEEADEGADPAEAYEDDDEQVPGNELTIAGEAYTPRDLLVGADRELRIVNEDDVDHTVTAWDGSFHAEVPAGETVTMTTPEPGAYPYVCEIHEHMRADLETM